MNFSIFTLSYHVIAMVLSASTFFFVTTEDVRKKQQNRLFRFLALEVFLSAVMQFTVPITDHFAYIGTALVISSVARFLYFAIHSALGPMFYVYIFMVSGSMYTSRVRNHLALMVPSMLMALLVLTTPFTNWVYYMDSHHIFHRNWGEYVIYAVSAFYVIMSIYRLFSSWKVINVRRRWALLFCVLMIVTGVGVQLVFQQLKVELMFEALGLIGVLLTVEREDDRVDTVSGAYNRSALIMDMGQYFDIGKKFYAIAIRILNVDLMRRMLGMGDSEPIIRMVVNGLQPNNDPHAVALRKDLYRADDTSFFILYMDDRKEQAYAYAEKLCAQFRETRELDGNKLKLDVVVLVAESGGEFSTTEDMLLLTDGEMPLTERKSLLTGDDLLFLKRNVAVENAVLRGVAENRYEVCYQPVYDRKTRSVKAAEAQLVLHDDELGILKQKDYMAAARKNNLEDDLDLRLADAVCTFINSGIPVELGVAVIGFRLYAIQCLREDFVRKFINICRKYEIENSRVTLEIHDFSEAPDHDILVESIGRLHEEGFRIAIDRYGMEDSNLKALLSYDSDIVCLDISAFVGGGSSMRDLDILRRGSIDLIRSLDKDVLVNGIVNEHQADLFGNSNASYLQGDYFSEAVSQNEFIAVLRGTQTAWREEQRARARSEAKSSFLANMSHEIRTPINAILGMNEMILRTSHDREVLSYAGDIERAGKSLLSLINNILDFSKIEAGNMELVNIQYDLSTLINDVVHLFRERMKGKGLAFHIDVDESLPDKLFGDEVRIRQILTNLLNNALKYTDEGDVTLSCGCESKTDSSVRLEFKITDTGRGIREEDIGKLFEKFQRLDEEKNSTIEGSGLGLAITSRLLHMMEGEIAVESKYGEGSSFRVVIPQKVLDSSPVGNLEERYLNEEAERRQYQVSFIARDARLLVVDDTAINIKVIRGLLRRTLIRIDEADSGLKCLDLARNNAYDLVLLDYKMPEMDGIETLHHLREIPGCEYGKLPVIALTANALSGSRENFLSEGFDDYLSKPVESSSLEAVIRAHLPKDKIMIRERKEA